MPYLWLKAAHVAAVLLFIGGLFAQCFAVVLGRRGQIETVALVARWDRRVTVPAMLFVWLSGALVAAEGVWFGRPWLWAKLAVVFALTGLHGIQSGKLRILGRGGQRDSAATEVPVLGFVAFSVVLIAVLVVTKPF